MFEEHLLKSQGIISIFLLNTNIREDFIEGRSHIWTTTKGQFAHGGISGGSEQGIKLRHWSNLQGIPRSNFWVFLKISS